jgi:DNA helicase HerA-like ATPase
MYSEGKIWMASSDKRIYLLPGMANRHGLIAGATGTGKTVTMKVMAESFSDMGVPVFFSDVKGDLSGMIRPGRDSDDMRERIARFGIENHTYKAYPTRFWDIFGESGHPVRVTVSDMGPLLLSRLLNLSEAQDGVLNVVFKAADEAGLQLLDFKDLRAMLRYVGENRTEYTNKYGNVTSASIGGIQRALLALENEGGEVMFGEPMLDIRDWMRTDFDGRGFINILSSVRLARSPKVYGTFLLWMLTELYERLPEVGDLPKPRIIFFFDEAHMLFSDAPKALVEKIVQVVKLVRSKGVGVYFVTQSPSDIPDEVLSQLSNRIQHGLRAYTPGEMKAVKAAADSFRKNPAFDTETALTELGTGEALVSFLDEKGVPSVVEKAKILPPCSYMGAADFKEIQQNIVADEFDLKYRETVDRESAYEQIEAARKKLGEEQDGDEEEETEEEETEDEEDEEEEEEEEKKSSGKKTSTKSKSGKKKKKTETAASKAVKQAANEVAKSVGENLLKSAKDATNKTTSAASQVASTALQSVLKSGANAILRGLFGNKK